MKQAALNAMQRDLKLVYDEATGPNARKLLVETFKKAHSEVLQSQKSRRGVEPGFAIAVDNKLGTPVEQAKNIIVSVYDYRREVATALIQELIKNSPRQSGAYALAHTIYVNGRPVGQVCPKLQPSDEVSITNTVPYARRIEVGKTKSGRSFVMKVPPRVYERTMKQVRSTYRNVVKLSFSYVDLGNSPSIKGGLSAGYLNERRAAGLYGPGRGVFQKRRQKVGEKVRYPTIRIDEL